MGTSFRKKIISTVYAVASGFVLFSSPVQAIFINEIHYDNIGRDAGEAVELAGAAGEDLAGWSLLFYNGDDGAVYKSYNLSGVFSDMQQGMGVLSFAIRGIQNGRADGMALLDATGSVLQFLSYEGSFTAMGGAALDMISTDIGVSESGSTARGDALLLEGNGRDYADFFWAAGQSSFGGINSGQGFTAATVHSDVAVPEPASGLLLLPGLLALAFSRRARAHAGVACTV
jgi:hypothetical protein